MKNDVILINEKMLNLIYTTHGMKSTVIQRWFTDASPKELLHRSQVWCLFWSVKPLKIVVRRNDLILQTAACVLHISLWFMVGAPWQYRSQLTHYFISTIIIINHNKV